MCASGFHLFVWLLFGSAYSELLLVFCDALSCFDCCAVLLYWTVKLYILRLVVILSARGMSFLFWALFLDSDDATASLAASLFCIDFFWLSSWALEYAACFGPSCVYIPSSIAYFCLPSQMFILRLCRIRSVAVWGCLFLICFSKARSSSSGANSYLSHYWVIWAVRCELLSASCIAKVSSKLHLVFFVAKFGLSPIRLVSISLFHARCHLLILSCLVFAYFLNVRLRPILCLCSRAI